MKYLFILLLSLLVFHSKAQNKPIQIHWIVGDTIDSFEKFTFNLFNEISDNTFESAYFLEKNDGSTEAIVNARGSDEMRIVFSETDLKIYHATIEATIWSDKEIRKSVLEHLNPPRKFSRVRERRKIILGTEFVVISSLVAYGAAILTLFSTGPLVTALIIVDLAFVPVGIGLIIDGITKARKYKKQTRVSY